MVARDLRDGDLARRDLRVEGKGDKVAEAVDGAAQEVKARAEIGHCGRREGLDGGVDGFGFGGGEGGSGGEGEVTSKKGFGLRR